VIKEGTIELQGILGAVLGILVDLGYWAKGREPIMAVFVHPGFILTFRMLRWWLVYGSIIWRLEDLSRQGIELSVRRILILCGKN
jgi:hypothetical protein